MTDTEPWIIDMMRLLDKKDKLTEEEFEGRLEDIAKKRNFDAFYRIAKEDGWHLTEEGWLNDEQT